MQFFIIYFNLNYEFRIMDIISKVDVGLNDIPKSESLIVDTKK